MAHYTNQVFENHEYIIELQLENEEKRYSMEALSGDSVAYKIITELHEAIQSYRQSRLVQAFNSGRTLHFPTHDQAFVIQLSKEGVHVKSLEKKKREFKVIRLYRADYAYEFKGFHDKITFNMNDFSDADAFIVLARRKVAILDKPPIPWKGRLILGGMGIFTIVGLNGWFTFIEFNNWLDFVCLYTGIILLAATIFLLISPLTSRVNRYIQRKQQEALDKLDP